MRKFIDKASKKPITGTWNSLTPSEVNPRSIFHYGIPGGSALLAYDPVQKILAISTIDGRIKLYGKDNTQCLLESENSVSSKYLQFIENQGILLNVTNQNNIEVWNLYEKKLGSLYNFNEEITSFTVLQKSFYVYVGDSFGNISVLKLDQESYRLVLMSYTIPFSATHGKVNGVMDVEVMYVLPQPMAESKRVLIIFRNGVTVLWGIQESKVIFKTGGNILQQSPSEVRKEVTSACWVSPSGNKIVIGYSNGDIFLWCVPEISNSKTASVGKQDLYGSQNCPTHKFNLGYKVDKVPIVSLKWIYRGGKASRLYVNGASGFGSSNSVQIVLLKESMESRTIKLVLPLPAPEACLDMEIISSVSEQNKHKVDVLLLLLKSGRIYVYNDAEITRYLLQCQSTSIQPLPRPMILKIPFLDSSITVSKFLSCTTDLPDSISNVVSPSNFTPFFPVFTDVKDTEICNLSTFNGFKDIKNLYLTGHRNGLLNFWDASSPFLTLILSLNLQSEGRRSLEGSPITTLYFDMSYMDLITGDQLGTVCFANLKLEQWAAKLNTTSSQETTKKAGSQTLRNVKHLQVIGPVCSISLNKDSTLLAVGSGEGYISIFDMKGPTLLFQKYLPSEMYPGILSLQFDKQRIAGLDHVVFASMKNSSVLALNGITGDLLGTDMVRAKKASRTILTQILDNEMAVKDSMAKPSLLLCSERTVYLYSLLHILQGVKKVEKKLKLDSTCCWASTFHSSHSAVGLVLLFTNGKIEVRSLPDLCLLKDNSLRGPIFSSSSLNFDCSLCSSLGGDIIMVNGDQEIIFASVLTREPYRFLNTFSDVCKRPVTLHEKPWSGPFGHMESKKGILNTLIKDLRSNKLSRYSYDKEVTIDANYEELSNIFSASNFDNENQQNSSSDDNCSELNIDDIDLDGDDDDDCGNINNKIKGQSIFSDFTKMKLGSKLQAVKGRLKWKKRKEELSKPKTERENDKPIGEVDQIKNKYEHLLGKKSTVLTTSEEEKLNDNICKLQAMDEETRDMQIAAQSFSTMAKNLLQNAERKAS